MIVIDSSALMAILQNEPMAMQCAAAINGEETVLICAATLAEVLIVAGGRGTGADMRYLIDGMDMSVIPLTESLARSAADAYSRWGKGFHAASLNFGDCFAYAVAKAHDCPLLFVGDDFAQTDVKAALAE